MEVTFPASCRGYTGAEIPPGLMPQLDQAALDGPASNRCQSSKYIPQHPVGGLQAPEVILHPKPRSGKQRKEAQLALSAPRCDPG